MDPLSALIGGGMSLIGGMMNQSSQQAINAANIQEQQWSAQGGYLPGLVGNARAAGLNPLAVLGQRGPDMAVQVSGQPGAGLMNAGRQISEADPRGEEVKDAALERAHLDIANARLAGNNAAIQGARDMFLNEQMEKYYAAHPDEPPPGVAGPSLGRTGAEWMTKLWNNPWNMSWPLSQ